MDNLTLIINSTDDPSDQLESSSRSHRSGFMLQQILVPLVFGVIFLVGVVGNSTLVYIVLRHKKLHNAPNIFIVSLALGDLLLILVSVPFSATVFTFISWPYGQAVCKLNEFLQTLSLGVSVFTLTALAGDRYTAIMYPMKKMGSTETTRTVLTAVGIWALALVLAVPDAVASQVESSPNYTHIQFCTQHPSAWGMTYVRAHILTRFLFYFLLPLSVIAAMYALMARVLVLSSKKMPGEGQAQKQLQARKKVARLVLGFVLVFALCWLPRHSYLMWYAFGNRHFTMFWLVTKIAGFCLAFLNSCLNPLALYFLSKQFQQLYNRYLCCCCCCPGCPCDQRSEGDKSRLHMSNSEMSQTSSLYKFNNTHRCHRGRNQKGTAVSSSSAVTSHSIC